MSKRKLYKSRKNKMIGGVCGGIAEYLNVDPTIVRVITGVLCLVKGLGVLVYIIACIVMPYNNEDFSEDDTENLKSANIDPDEKKGSRSKASSAGNADPDDKDKKMHSEEEFNSYFKK